MINVRNLYKSFGKNEVLKDINETIKKGEVVVIIGPSGSGKSTFLRCLNLLEEPTSGIINFEGEDITDKNVDINKIREKMGMVFQQFNLFPHKTVMENQKEKTTKDYSQLLLISQLIYTQWDNTSKKVEEISSKQLLM